MRSAGQNPERKTRGPRNQLEGSAGDPSFGARMGEQDCQALWSGQHGAVEGTYTMPQASPQWASPHTRGSFCYWFIRGPNPPRPPARGSLSDSGGGRAPNLGHWGLRSAALTPPRSLALPSTLPASASLRGPPGSVWLMLRAAECPATWMLRSPTRVGTPLIGAGTHLIIGGQGSGIFLRQRVWVREKAGRGVSGC